MTAAGVSRWGPHFPDAARSRFHWGSHFPDAQPAPTPIPAAGPGVAATFGLRLEDGLQVTYSWQTSNIKSYSGLETRAANHSLPSQVLKGNAYVAGSDVLAERGILARYAAAGSAFLLGLPHEGLSLSAASSGVTVNVWSTSYIDWAVRGQRVLVVSGDYTQSIVGIVQGSTANTILLDVAPGSVGALGGMIMPAVPVLLDAQQGFQRFTAPGSPEIWQVNARGIQFGYESAPSTAAWVSLIGTIPSLLRAGTLAFATPGTIGNGATFALTGDGVLTAGNLTVSGQNFVAHFRPGFTTMGHLEALIAGLFSLTGWPVPTSTYVLQASDAFTSVTFANGTDKSWGTMGTGATVATYQGRPLWDRRLAVPDGGQVTDSLQSMVELVDLGGVPTQLGSASAPDWGRQVVMVRELGVEWQWCKAFLSAVRGAGRAFWLPTWRGDLTASSLIPGFLTIDATVGDFTAWQYLRSEIQLVDSTGAIQYLHLNQSSWISSGGTATVQITSSNPAYNVGGGGPILLAGSIALLSWIDLCRLESDDVTVTFTDAKFAINLQARAVQQ